MSSCYGSGQCLSRNNKHHRINQMSFTFVLVYFNFLFQFDPAMQRHTAMRLHTFDHFRATGKNAIVGISSIIVPMFAFGYWIYKRRSNLEAKYRRGEVAYKDRRFKFI